jgi:transposase
MRLRKVIIKADSKIIEKQLQEDPKFLQGVRLFALHRIAQGESPENISKLLNIAYSNIMVWIQKYNKQGVSGLRSRIKTTHLIDFTDTQKKELLHEFINKSLTYNSNLKNNSNLRKHRV